MSRAIKVQCLTSRATQRLLELCRTDPQITGAIADKHGNVVVRDGWRWGLVKSVFGVTETSP